MTMHLCTSLFWGTALLSTAVDGQAADTFFPTVAPGPDGGLDDFAFPDFDDDFMFPPSRAPVTESPVTAVPTSTCYDTLRELDGDMIAMHEQGLDFKQKVFTLCPNTVFRIGFINLPNSSDCCSDGDFPIFSYSNTLIKCGEDGKSSNNCIITGGERQIISVFSFNDDPNENVIYRGLTFAGASIASSIISDPGDYTYQDCVFRDNVASSSVILMLYATNRRLAESENTERSRLMELAHPHGSHRRRAKVVHPTRRNQDSTNLKAVVNVVNCTFENNSPGATTSQGFTQHTLILLEGKDNTLNVEDSVFHNNDFDDFDPLPHAMVKAKSGAMSFKNNCFVDNNVVGYGVVQAFEGAEVVESEGNYGTAINDLTCSFIAISDINPDSSTGIVCSGFESSVCLIEGAPEPKVVETPPPSRSPTALETDVFQSMASTYELLRAMMLASFGLAILNTL